MGGASAPSNCRRWLCLVLEDQTQAILNFATVISHELGRNLAKVSAVEVDCRVCQLHTVEQVICFQTSFQSEAFRKFERLVHRQVSLPDAGAIQSVISPRFVAR